jgi:hypothetical protein
MLTLVQLFNHTASSSCNVIPFVLDDGTKLGITDQKTKYLLF